MLEQRELLRCLVFDLRHDLGAQLGVSAHGSRSAADRLDRRPTTRVRVTRSRADGSVRPSPPQLP